QDYPDKVLIASIMGENEQQWQELARLVEEAGADMIECNFSCPLLDTQISDYRLGPTFAADIRAWLADMPHRELARHLSGGLTYG
ncbi:hypothetical protein MJL27_25740, partial [Salmonella enterica subsp. enterica serovar Anatum]|nr:hypothetical protein [Salmonella enterica subsp. enterica serovar Anatum]